MTCCPPTDENADQPISYDADFDGSEPDRHCTDCLCCLFFVAFVIGMIGILVVTLPISNYMYLYTPTDHRGLLCGSDNSAIDVPNASDLPDLTDKPFLFWVRPGKPGYSRSFCVTECPKSGYFFDTIAATLALAADFNGSIPGLLDSYECGVVENETTVYPTVENYSRPGIPERFFCPYASQPVAQRCLPNKDAFGDIIDFAANATVIAELAEFTTALAGASYVARAVQDVYDLLLPILLCVGVSLVLSIVWLLLLRCLAAIIVWVTILLSFAALAALTYCCYQQSVDKWENHQPIESYSFGFVSQELNKKVFTYFFYIFLVIDAIFILLVLFMCSRIALSIRIIKLVSRLFGNLPALFFFPLVIYFLMVVWWIFCILVA
jgi:choline transporter-like protein 2/4/5